MLRSTSTFNLKFNLQPRYIVVCHVVEQSPQGVRKPGYGTYFLMPILCPSPLASTKLEFLHPVEKVMFRFVCAMPHSTDL